MKHFFSVMTLITVTLTNCPGCATSKEELLPAGEQSMLESGRGSLAAEVPVLLQQPVTTSWRRPLTETEQQDAAQTDRSYSRTQESEISQQFPRLPNPDMVMYASAPCRRNSPVPGYSTVFSFYSQTQYAMPGERMVAF
ncbi:TIGR03751 family conjugal transfer lipoprotein [Escherichia coli]